VALGLGPPSTVLSGPCMGRLYMGRPGMGLLKRSSVALLAGTEIAVWCGQSAGPEGARALGGPQRPCGARAGPGWTLAAPDGVRNLQPGHAHLGHLLAVHSPDHATLRPPLPRAVLFPISLRNANTSLTVSQHSSNPILTKMGYSSECSSSSAASRMRSERIGDRWEVCYVAGDCVEVGLGSEIIRDTDQATRE
jgi:hypothetical protein